jgi:hypothetical protein
MLSLLQRSDLDLQIRLFVYFPNRQIQSSLLEVCPNGLGGVLNHVPIRIGQGFQPHHFAQLLD